MGTRRRTSTERLRIRASLSEDERSTLTPCPACGGEKVVSRDMPGGRYLSMRCRWCVGTGAVDHEMRALFLRWLRILNWNFGRCATRA